jgi:hypothetical protein
MSELNVKKVWYKKPWAIILGVLLLPVMLLLSPFLLFLVWKKKHWNKWVKTSISVIPVLWGLIFIIGIVSSISDNNKKIKQAEELLAQANTDIASNNIEEAKSNLVESIELNSANEAVVLLEDIEKTESQEHINDTLTKMTDEEFELLQNGQLNKLYFENEFLNSFFISNLTENIPVREKLLSALKEEQKKIEAEEKAELLKKEAEDKVAAEKKAIEDRKNLIESQFSAWDGSHNNLTKLIKESMNDPKSYDHDETLYRDMGDYLLVTTTFRGKNAFGGVIKDSVSAKIALDGTILEIIE